MNFITSADRYTVRSIRDPTHISQKREVQIFPAINSMPEPSALFDYTTRFKSHISTGLSEILTFLQDRKTAKFEPDKINNSILISKTMFTKSIPASSTGLKSAFIRFIIYGSFVYLTAEVLKLAASQENPGNKFNERSIVEYCQNSLLLITAAIYLYVSYTQKHVLPLAFGLFAFIFASLIREQDALLDEFVFDGAWQTGAFGVLGVATFLIFRNYRLFLANVNDFVSKFSFGILLSGILTTYIFARLYGRKVFWMTVMEQEYIRDVKNVSEESLELFGYGLILVGTIEFLIYSKSSKALSHVLDIQNQRRLNASA